METPGSSRSRFIEICGQWPLAPEAPAIMDPVASDLPTLVLSGQFDPVTPVRYGHLAAETLEQPFVADFPNTGHGASAGSLCGIGVLDPAVEPDSSCKDDIGLEFLLPGARMPAPRAAPGLPMRQPAPWPLAGRR